MRRWLTRAENLGFVFADRARERKRFFFFFLAIWKSPSFTQMRHGTHTCIAIQWKKKKTPHKNSTGSKYNPRNTARLTARRSRRLKIRETPTLQPRQWKPADRKSSTKRNESTGGGKTTYLQTTTAWWTRSAVFFFVCFFFLCPGCSYRLRHRTISIATSEQRPIIIHRSLPASSVTIREDENLVTRKGKENKKDFSNQ